jgi:uncharacterized protein (TIGR02145 family)
MEEQNPVAISSKVFNITFLLIATIGIIVFTPLGGWLFDLQADTPVPGQTLVGVLKSFECGVDTVEDADGNVYNTVAIGTQCWMSENMRIGNTINGFIDQTDNSIIERWCYNNDDGNCDTNLNPNTPDGGLYRWNEAMQYSTEEGAQGICPIGWHIPSDQEFKDLEIFLGMTPAEADGTDYRGTDQGTQLQPNGSSGFEGNLAGYSDAGFFIMSIVVDIFGHQQNLVIMFGLDVYAVGSQELAEAHHKKVVTSRFVVSATILV